MTSLYNCRIDGPRYRITKFTEHFEVESSYLTDARTCDCPAGKRPMCRHREMLPKFLHRQHVGDEWFFDFDHGGWVQGWKEPEPELSKNEIIDDLPMLHSVADSTGDFDSPSTGANPVGATNLAPSRPAWRRF